MADFQTILDQVARVVGGTAPDSTNRPRWFSGAQTGDSTGVAGIKGCYSAPPETIQDVPTGLVMPLSFIVPNSILTQGEEYNEDLIRLVLFVARNDPQTQWATLAPYRDTVAAAFRSHLQLFASLNVLDASLVNGKSGILDWGGTPYLVWDMTIRVRRMFTPTYTA